MRTTPANFFRAPFNDQNEQNIKYPKSGFGYILKKYHRPNVDKDDKSIRPLGGIASK
jgi:hypothetical protein